MPVVRLMLATAVTSLALAAGAQVSVYPTAPNSQQTVRVQVPAGAWHGDESNKAYPDPKQTRVSMSNNKIDVVVVLGLTWGFLLPTPGLDLAIGQLPPGDYQVEVVKKAANGSIMGSQGTARFTVAAVPATRPNMNVTGLWWNPSESGWGVNIAQNGDALFATWFLYAPDGAPIWYHMPAGSWQRVGEFDTFTGAVYRTTGPALQSCDVTSTDCPVVPFDPTRVTRTPVGTATFSFDPVHFGTGFMTLTMDGKRTGRGINLMDF